MRLCPECKRSFPEQDFRVCPVDGASLINETSASIDPMLDRVLGGRFRIVEAIGKGGMGMVYKAVHTQMDRICAIKLLAPVSSDTESAVARFRREAKMSSRIDSPNAVTIYDFGEAEPGLLYLAMEYIEGESLAEVLMRERYLPLERVVNITNQIARALTAAHSLGIIHRDLKPANIMLTRKNGEHEFVKVLDFGIAKSLTDNNDESLTQTGALLGTPTYMSPEQVVGETVDSRTDVYSLSIMVYQMLTGELPFDGNNSRTQMMNRIHHDPKPFQGKSSSLTEAIEFVVMSGLSRDPAKRTPNVQQFAAALNAATKTGAVSTGELPTLLRKSEATPRSSTANDPTEISPSGNTSESVITLVSPPRIDVNIPEQDRVPVHQTASEQHFSATPSARNTGRPSLLIPLIVVASVLIVVALLSAGGYYVYVGSKPTPQPNASAPDQSAKQTSLSGAQSNKQSAVNGDTQSADFHYAQGKLHQEAARALAFAGSTAASKGKNEEAIAAYRKAIAIQPNFAEAHENLAVALYDLGNPEEAVTEFEIAIPQYGTPAAQVWTNYGMALLLVKRFQDAAAAFGKAAALNPNDAEVHYYRGFALHFAGDLGSSRKAFTEYLNVSPAGEHAPDVKAILAGRATPSLDTILVQK